MGVYSAGDRWLPCDACGLAIQTPIQGGTTQCSRCQAPFAAYARPDTVIPRSPPTDEGARRARLRAQDGKPMLPPPGFEQLISGSAIPPHKMQEARMVWSATRRQLQGQPGDLAAADRLVWLTTVLRNTLGAQDEAAIRALLEGAMEVLIIPRHRQMIRCHLARGAVKEGDLQSAEAWLEGCDPGNEDLPADSSYRITRAFIDLAKDQPQSVLEVLGGNEQEVPIDDSLDPLATVFRAGAWEKLGQIDTARAVLTAFMARGGHAGSVEAVVKAMPPSWQICAQSMQGARQDVRQAVGQRAASSGGGAMVGWIILIVGCIPLVVLGIMIASDIFVLPMLTMLIFPFVFGSWGLRMIRSANRAKEIAQGGLRGIGRIVGTSMTGTRINGVPLMRIDLQIQVEGHPPVMASTNKLMYPGQELAGREVPVIWHPKYPADVVMEI